MGARTSPAGAAAQNRNAPAAVLGQLAGENGDAMAQTSVNERRGVASDPDTPPDVLEQLAGDEVGSVREAVAQNRNTPPDVLERLADEEYWGVRDAVAANRSTPTHVLEQLAGCDDWAIRHAVAGNPSTPAHVLEQLTADPTETVRVRAKGELAYRGGATP